NLNVGCISLVKLLRGCHKSFSKFPGHTLSGRSLGRGTALINSPKIAPFGSWKSPITADLIVGGSVGLSQPQFDGSDIYWLELRPTEGGRNVIVKRSGPGSFTDITPQPFNARTRVREY